MNIPLNIDWQQILLHLLNFAILAFGLYLLLYKPVKSFMDKRTDHYRQMDEQAREKHDAAAALEAARQTQLAELDTELRREREKAEKETAERAEAALESARAQAEAILADARESAEAEKRRIVASAGREIAELAAAAAEKLMKDGVSHG